MRAGGRALWSVLARTEARNTPLHESTARSRAILRRREKVVPSERLALRASGHTGGMREDEMLMPPRPVSLVVAIPCTRPHPVARPRVLRRAH